MRYADALAEARAEFDAWERSPRIISVGIGEQTWYKVVTPAPIVHCWCGKRAVQIGLCERHRRIAYQINQGTCFRCGRPGWARRRCQSCYEKWLRRNPKVCWCGRRYRHGTRCYRCYHPEPPRRPEKACPRCDTVHRCSHRLCDRCYTLDIKARRRCVCGAPRYSRYRWCHRHYLERRQKTGKPTCAAQECTRVSFARGLCGACYSYSRDHGIERVEDLPPPSIRHKLARRWAGGVGARSSPD